GGTSASPPLCNQLTHRRHELDRHVHRSVRRRLVGGLIFRYRFFIGLRFVMLQNAAHALFVPAGGIFRLPHCRLLRRRRSALRALGPSWYAVAILHGSTKHVFDFRLCYTVAIDVWLFRLRIDVVTNLHEGMLSPSAV